MAKKKKVVAIIQARMASSRLPGKVLLPLSGKSVLWWMTKRAGLAKLVDEVVIATTQAESNIPILDFCGRNGVSYYAYGGNENDVIGRVLAAAKFYEADIIVDLTGDCPLVDPRHIDFLIETLLEGEYDYASNCVWRDWPDGLDIQVYLTKTLQKCKKIFAPKQHCGWNIAQQTKIFDTDHWNAPPDMHWPELGLTLDTLEDYKLLKFIFYFFSYELDFQTEDIIYFLRAHPELVEINKKIQRKTPEEG